MNANLIRKIAATSLLMSGLGVSAVAFASSGAGSAGSTGGPARMTDRHETVAAHVAADAAEKAAARPLTEIGQNLSGQGAANPVDTESSRAHQTVVDDSPAATQSESGLGAHNRVDMESSDRGAAARRSALQRLPPNMSRSTAPAMPPTAPLSVLRTVSPPR